MDMNAFRKIGSEIEMARYDVLPRHLRDNFKFSGRGMRKLGHGDELDPPKQPRRAKDRYVTSVRSLT